MPIDCKLLDGGFLKRTTEARQRVTVVEIVEVALVLARRAGDVEPGLRSCAREGDVRPLLQPRLPSAEDEGALDGQALCGG